ncbi:FAD-dependent oxidoreductase [Arthrospira platensis FACHB-439]|uniref:FAD-dependent oxidoreductase n=1 Tax=Limnospira platensis TaxID=118562 RepID=UPI001686D8EE|nr:FAD-dependent oxidoreductase [Arthrospira platensis FACHB-439]
MEQLQTDVLVVGGGAGGTAAALQSARGGANTILVSEFSWLGGMLTSAGVAAPDGNELVAFQTGLWGAFLRELRQKQPTGLDWGWVSFFNYDPRIGAQIWSDWVKSQKNLHWISGYAPLEVLRKGDRITGVRFPDFTINAQVTIDATELGDILAQGEIPYRWGWEWQQQWQEPSAPIQSSQFTDNCPVQDPTWVVLLQDFGETQAPAIKPTPEADFSKFQGAWDGYDPQQFLNYGRLPGGLMMINWPHKGNDYGVGLDRLIASAPQKQAFWRESLQHSLNFAAFIQQHLGRRYGLAESIFPHTMSAWKTDLGLTPQQLGAFAIHPYYRESRRLCGVQTITENHILPVSGSRVAALPIDHNGQCEAIAIGNYPNDHHYSAGLLPVKLKLLRWGGRWTGTPFTIPYRTLIPETTEGLIVAEKNISVSHIANGATRLQPVVLGIGQAAGMAAALSVQQRISPRMLSVRSLQQALLTDPIAPAAIIPLFNLTGDRPDWQKWQQYYLDHPQAYPITGEIPQPSPNPPQFISPSLSEFSGQFHRHPDQEYTLTLSQPHSLLGQVWSLVTLHPHINQQLQTIPTATPITVCGRHNSAGRWLLVEVIKELC